MSKRRLLQQQEDKDCICCCCCGGGGGGKRPRPARKKHLYLMLDDWDKGFRMHKIDVDALGSGSDHGHLPEPALLQFAAPPAPHHPTMSFTAMGTNIFIATNPHCAHTPALVYDTDTSGLAVGPCLPAQLLCGGPDVVVPTATGGETLYALTSYSFVNQQHSFEAMSWAPTGAKGTWSPTMAWSWRTVPSPPPFRKDQRITSYALHPDGRTIFVSAHNHEEDEHSIDKGTYSFDTERCEWMWQGQWVLPFQGRGYYDGELDAWVGLRSDGYICSCQVASRSSSSNSSTSCTEPEWKTAREKLFLKEPPERRLTGASATLTYMGNSRFCIVECALREGVDKKRAFVDVDSCELHLTAFGLKYNHKGELQTTTNHTTSSYLVSKHDISFSPVAFWM